MQFTEGKIVVYRSAELCRIKSVGQYAPDGINTREYCILTPLGSERSTYYVPMECAEQKLRDPLTKEEVLALIDSMDGAGAEWCSDGNRRKARQNEILSSGSYESVIGMAGAIYIERERRRQSGKKLTASDERAMKSAEKMIYGEFGYVLGIEPESVPEFIAQRLSKKK